MPPIDLHADLNPEQKRAVTQTEGPVLILAGAGSGKTKALTHRIAHLIQNKKVSPYNILAVTFTNKAAKEMTQRVQSLLGAKVRLPWMGTFHRICLLILRQELSSKAQLKRGPLSTNNHILNSYGPNFSIYDEGDAVATIKRVMNELALDPKKINPKAVKNFIDGAKNELMTPAQYEPHAHGYFSQQVARIYRRYQAMLISANAMDFDDIIMNTVNLLQQTPELLAQYQQQFCYLMIDEYQDTNHAQYTLIKLLADPQCNLCVVGDDFQSIYSWRGADFRNILNFEKDYPKTTVIKLEQNYRSTQTILDVAQQVINQNVNRSDKKLWTKNPAGLPVTIAQCSNDTEEADFVIREIRSLYRHFGSYNQMAILYRTNAQSRLLEETLLRQSLPYRLVGALRFYERKEIKDTIAYLKFIINPQDFNALIRVINLPPKGIGEKTLEKIINQLNATQNDQPSDEIMPPKAVEFFETIEKIRLKIATLKPAELIEKTLQLTGYKNYIVDGTIEGEARWENIKELLAVASTHESIEEFLENIALIADIDNYNADEEAITLMTIHSAKGLEFPIVFMVGMEEGIFPHSRSLNDNSQMEEERRLCYVGMTRAKERLYLIHADRRMGFTGLVSNPKSRFLDDLPDNLTELI